MSVICTLSNHYKYKLGKKEIDLSADTFGIILMNDTFEFDPDAHATLADVTGSPSSELETGNGYTRQTKTMTGGTWTEDDTNARGVRVFDSVSWTATGGVIGPVGAAIIYDDSTDDDTVVGCIDFGEDITTLEGATLQIAAPAIENA